MISIETINQCSEYIEKVLNIKDIKHDPFILQEVCVRCEGDMKRISNAHPQYDNIALTKQAGIITYWFSKLKPIISSSPKNNRINELYSVILGFVVCFSNSKMPLTINSEIFEDLLYSLRYRIVPQEVLGLIYSQFLI